MSDDLAAIRVRYDAATPYTDIEADDIVWAVYGDGYAFINCKPQDEAFINHAYADITTLLALVDEQAATIARLVDLVHSFVDDPYAGRYTEGLSGEDRCTYCSFDIITYEHDTDCIIVRARAALVGAPDGEIGA